MLKQKIFLSYAKKNRDAIEDFLTLLKPLERDGELSVWEDHQITIGTSWASSIETAIDTCTLAILWVTKEFLASEYIYQTEMRRLLAREDRRLVVIAPIFADACAVGRAKFPFEDSAGCSKTRILTDFQGFRKQNNTPDQTLADLCDRSRAQWIRTLADIVDVLPTLWPPGVVRPFVDPTGWPFVYLPGGTFRMGSPAEERDRYRDEGPLRQVTLSPFVLAATPVTQVQFATQFGDHKSYFSGADHPVESVTWDQTIAFCNALSTSHKLRPAYKVTGNTITWNAGTDGYRLLTEAEWEYAVRAGTESAYFFGNDPAELGRFAWFGEGESESGSTHPVAHKHASPWGLYDMYGNVWEWCWDWYADSYDPKDVVDPRGPAKGETRLLRGGSFWNEPRDLRSASRDGSTPSSSDGHRGFRICRSIPASIDR